MRSSEPGSRSAADHSRYREGTGFSIDLHLHPRIFLQRLGASMRRECKVVRRDMLEGGGIKML